MNVNPRSLCLSSTFSVGALSFLNSSLIHGNAQDALSQDRGNPDTSTLFMTYDLGSPCFWWDSSPLPSKDVSLELSECTEIRLIYITEFYLKTSTLVAVT